MKRSLCLCLNDHQRKCTVIALVCSWLSGLCFGFLAAKNVAIDFCTLCAALQKEAAVSIFAVMLFPFVVSILLVYMRQSWLLTVIAFFKSFSFVYVSRILMRDFGSSGWLIQFLIMFSDCASLPLLWWLWCRLLDSKREALLSLSIPPVLAAIAIGIMDDRYISPVLSALQISQKG